MQSVDEACRKNPSCTVKVQVLCSLLGGFTLRLDIVTQVSAVTLGHVDPGQVGNEEEIKKPQKTSKQLRTAVSGNI